MRSTLPIGLLALALLAGCGRRRPQAGPPPAPGGAPTSTPAARRWRSRPMPTDADILKTLGITVTRPGPQRFGTTAVVHL